MKLRVLSTEIVRRLKRLPRATLAIIALNIIGYVHEGFALNNTFEHTSFQHIYVNMCLLWILGVLVEETIGWKGFAVCYFLSGTGGKVLWHIMDGVPSAGASGAVLGIGAMYLCTHRFFRSWNRTDILGLFMYIFSIAIKWYIVWWFLMDIYKVTYHVDKLAAYWGHIGGFLTGAIIGKVTIEYMERSPPKNELTYCSQ